LQGRVNVGQAQPARIVQVKHERHVTDDILDGPDTLFDHAWIRQSGRIR
jgi:hypothetical protein